MAEIRTLGGYAINDNGSRPEIISDLESLLIEAKNGNITAIAVAYLDASRTCNTLINGSEGNSAALGGSIVMLSHRYFSAWRELS